MKKTASDYHREHRGNCAQAVTFAFGSKYVGARGVEEVFDGCGGGRTPSGHQACKAIRGARRVPCTTCVEIAAESLENHSRKRVKG